jgi:hypothetical protein
MIDKHPLPVGMRFVLHRLKHTHAAPFFLSFFFFFPPLRVVVCTVGVEWSGGEGKTVEERKYGVESRYVVPCKWGAWTQLAWWRWRVLVFGRSMRYFAEVD